MPVEPREDVGGATRRTASAPARGGPSARSRTGSPCGSSTGRASPLREPRRRARGASARRGCRRPARPSPRLARGHAERADPDRPARSMTSQGVAHARPDRRRHDRSRSAGSRTGGAGRARRRRSSGCGGTTRGGFCSSAGAGRQSPCAGGQDGEHDDRRRTRGRRTSAAAGGSARAPRTGSSTSRLVSQTSDEREREDRQLALRPELAADDEGHQDDQRPVPEVDRVGDVAEELHRRAAEQRPTAPSARAARRRAITATRAERPAAAPPSRGTACARCRRSGRDERSPPGRAHDSAARAPRRAARSRPRAPAARRAPNSQARAGVTK